MIAVSTPVRTLPARAALLVALLVAACDPRVPSTNGEALAAGAGVVLSAAGETCGATSQCADGLRCIGHVCRPARSSRLGDYHQAAGRAALARGDAAAASEAFARAVASYEADKLDAPAALLCDAGAALLRKKGDPRAAEQAARLLHRCVLTAPPGSPDYGRGLAELAELEALGLEPALLAKDQPGDMYLTRPAVAPTRPPAASLSPSVASNDKGYAAFIELARARASSALVACFETYAKATQKTRLDVAVNLKYRQTLGDDDEIVGAKLELEPSPPPEAGGPLGAAHDCVKAALAPVAADFAKDLRASRGNWQGGVQVTVAAAP
jgi:hypothetical protein